jgi:hypothetical protein
MSDPVILPAGVISGYGVHINTLTDEDVRVHKLGNALAGIPAHECVAVHGEDLGRCLAAVVHFSTGRLLWSDADGNGTPINQPAFGNAVVTVVRGVLEEAGIV